MRVRIKPGWENAGKIGKNLERIVYVGQGMGQSWTAVLWEGEEDPDWHKTAGLDEVGPRMEVFCYRDGKKMERECPANKTRFHELIRRDSRYFIFRSKNDTEVVYEELTGRKIV